MHKIRYTTILLLAVFCIIPIVSILMIHHLTLTDTLSKMGSGTLGKSATIMKIDNYKTADNITDSISSQKSNIAIYTDSNDENGTVRYMYFNKKYINLPMNKGRFFKASDFTDDNYVCVIGKDRINETYEQGNNTFFSINGKGYRVIGVLGYENSTVFDSYVFVNMCASDLNDSCIFIFDFLNLSKSDSAVEEINDYYASRGITSELYSQATAFSESVMPQIAAARWFICLLAACFFCLLLISIRWVDQQKRELAIHRLVGASQKNIALLITCKYLAVFTISFLVGFVYCNVIYPAYFSSLVKGYVVCIIFIIVFLVWSICHILRAPIEEVIQ